MRNPPELHAWAGSFYSAQNICCGLRGVGNLGQLCILVK